MSTIGTFRKIANEYTGSIKTLSISATKVRVVPLPASTNDKAPTHRVYVGAVELGAAWQKQVQDSEREYLAVKLDDPSFPAPIYANLTMADEAGELFQLIWNRPGN